jgi:hypothetical protein
LNTNNLTNPFEESKLTEPLRATLPFTEEQINDLTVTLETCLIGKIQEELRLGMNQESLQRVLDNSVETFQMVATKMVEQDCFSVRELLCQEILVVKDPQENENGDQSEVEVLRPLDLIDRFEKMIGVEESNDQLALNNTQKQCILIVL